MCSNVAQVVFEAPPGLKQNLQRTYGLWSSDFLAGHVASSTARRSSNGDEQGVRHSGSMARQAPAAIVPLRAQMLFMLAWFHAALQERQNYVPVVSGSLVHLRSEVPATTTRAAIDV